MKSCASANSWFACVRPRPAAKQRLFCFPHAGGGASLFRAWPETLPASVEVVPVQLPGRETRFRDPPIAALPPLVRALGDAMLPLLDRPFAFFGHSMGALLAYEVARWLRDRQQEQPFHLLASACPAPRCPRPEAPIHNLPEQEFFQKLHQYRGTPKAVFENNELLELLLPMLRADFALCETYSYTPGRPLDYPITVLGGLKDDTVTWEELDAWRLETRGAFRRRMVPGDHFFLTALPPLLLPVLMQDACADRPASADRTDTWRAGQIHVGEDGLNAPHARALKQDRNWAGD